MSWGNCYFYYLCPSCGKRFKYATDMIPVFGDDFGRCPDCHEPCTPEREGAIIPEDALYPEVEE